MRIERLDLCAYGPFTDRTLDLSRPGVHLVVGLNEAGKSTTLAAISDALFGFPHRSSAGFVHDQRNLKLGMSLRRSDGSTIEFTRLKKTVKSLLRADGSEIGDDEFARFIGAVNQEVFERMYGINHSRLRAGGADLLAGGGEVSQAILGASFGSVNLPAALVELQQRAGSLFRPQGKSRPLNEAIERYKTASANAVGLSLPPARFTEVVNEITQLKDASEGLKSRKESVSAEREQIQKLISLFNRLGQRRVALDELAEFPAEARLLREGLADELSEAMSSLRDLRADEKRHADLINQQSARLAELPADPRVLEHKSSINQLNQQLEKYRSELEELPELRHRLQILRRSLRTELDRMELTVEIENARGVLTVPTSVVERVAEFAELGAELRAGERSTEAALSDHKRQLASSRQRLAALGDIPDATHLAACVSAVRSSEDLAASHRLAAEAAHKAAAEFATAVARLGLKAVSPDGFISQAVPTRASLNDLRKVHDKWEADRKQLSERIAEVRSEKSDAEDKLTKLLKNSDVPTPGELESSRLDRDAHWATIRESWKRLRGGAALSDEPDAGELSNRYESAIRESDSMADRMRLHADAVANRSALEARIRELIEKEGDLLAAMESSDSEGENFDRKWAELWAPLGIEPGNPDEMRAWLDDHGDAAELAGKAIQTANNLNDVVARVERQSEDLVAALGSVGVHLPGDSPLATLIHRAEMELTSLNEKLETRSKLETEISVLQGQVTDASAKSKDLKDQLTRWDLEWSEASAETQFTGLSPFDAQARISGASALLTELDHLEDLRSRITQIESAVALFRERIDKVSTDLDESTEHRDHSSILERISERLSAAEAIESQRSALEERLSELREAKQIASSELKGKEAELHALLEEVSVGDESELHEAIDQSNQLRRLRDTVDDISRQLASESGGLSADELEDMLAGRDLSKLQLELTDLDNEISGMDSQIEEINKKLGEMTAEQKRWDGTSKAADALVESQLALSDIGSLTEEYLALQVASELLADFLNAYREQNQGPILKRATPWFSAMTGGSFATLEASYESGNSPVLMAVRPNGVAVGITGLSEGTRDQLYLSLRLAALTESALSGESFPLILDDILMTFDDARASAALRVLGEVSETTQVLMFTHHRHLVPIAQQALGEKLTCHSL